MLSESDPISKDPSVTIELLGKATTLLFGLNKENVHPDLFRTAYAKMSEAFVGCTVQDVRNSFNDAVIEKKAYTTLTRDELIQPIRDYWQKKQVIKYELRKVESKVSDELAMKEEALKFRTDAHKLYLECLNNGTGWTGTDMQAKTFAKNFADMFSQEFKTSVIKKAQLEFHEKKELATSNPILGVAPPVPVEYIFCRMIVNEALTRKFNLIVE
tara:strand:+ start:2418 stop:3059 length:642 start_codon:yes stop_codon:yes gene_type:complete